MTIFVVPHIKMDDPGLQYDAKIKRMLEKFLQPNYKVKNDVYLNSLLTYFAGNAEIGCKLSECNLLTYRIFPEWVLHAVTMWSNNAPQPSPSILSFAITLASYLTKEETTFQELNSNNVYDKLITIGKPRCTCTAPTIKLAFIKLLSALLKHPSGISYLVTTNYWLDALNLSLANQTLYITKDGHRFMADLLGKTVNDHPEFCANVVKVIMGPLSDSAFNSLRTTENYEINDETVYKSLSPSLTLIANILEIFLENSVTAKDFNIITVFKNNFHLEQCINNFLLIAQSCQFIFELHKILYTLIFFDCVMNVDQNKKLNHQAAVTASKKFYSIFSTNITKGYSTNVMKFAYMGHIYWKNISAYSNGLNLSLDERSLQGTNPIFFENQLMILQVLPMIVIGFTLLGVQKIEENIDDIRDEFLNKIFKMITIPTLRTGYQWKDWLTNSPALFDHATMALQYVLKSKQFYTREIGATVFQTLIYCLLDIVLTLKERPEQMHVLMKECNYLGLLLEAIAVYIEEFQLSWRDSVETICVMNIAFDFLSLPTWPPKIVVKALKLVDISISKYMSPNLALLIDRINDSTMVFMGPLLYAKLHDASWEVRDSALEVLCTISYNANTKFTSFQKIVLETKLPAMVLRLAMKDQEGFVRASALKCLQEMIKVRDFWNDIMRTQDLNVKALEVLQTETEGIVRTEAAALVAAIYEQYHYPSHLVNTLYDVMTHAACNDFHWEVKMKALTFWDVAIKNHLQHHGMIDGSFPSVVFSKEHRKIVTLNDYEVQKRLVKVLHQLSEIGCLAVLSTASQDDCDLEVSKSATRITQRFTELLTKYKINFDNAVLSTPASPIIRDDMSSPATYSTSVPSVSSSPGFSPMMPPEFQPRFSEDAMDSIINEILSVNDSSLLKNVFQAEECRVKVDVRGKQIMQPAEFLRFAQQDLESRIKEKQKWLKGIDEFGSLLDDILQDYDDGDVNSMDCY